jgi:hypothetical protein
MPITDYLVRRAAQSYADTYGSNALDKARERVLFFQKNGDSIGADMWIRVMIALKDLINTGHIAPASDQRGRRLRQVGE